MQLGMSALCLLLFEHYIGAGPIAYSNGRVFRQRSKARAPINNATTSTVGTKLSRVKMHQSSQPATVTMNIPAYCQTLSTMPSSPTPGIGQLLYTDNQSATREMSALPPKADMCGALAHVCFGPKADIDATSTLDTHCECHTGEALAMSFGQTVTSSLLRH